MLENILLIAGGVLSGLVVALTVIAPRTKTKLDDEALEYLKDLENLVESLGGKTPPAPAVVVAAKAV